MRPAAVVVGFGLTGRAVTVYLVASGFDVVVVDDRPGPGTAGAVEELGARLGAGDPARLVAGCGMVVPSPGVPARHPVLSAASAGGIPIRSEIELAWERLDRAGRTAGLVAVTGTNGKTTVTTLVAAALVASGRRAVAAGNIGVPLLEAVAQPTDVVVAEVSSFQLHWTDHFRPDVSCWLNLAPDHLDWHPDLAHYAGSKARVWAAQSEGDIAVYNLDDPGVLAAATDPPGAVPPGVARTPFTVGPPPAEAFGVIDGTIVGPNGAAIVPVASLFRALPHDVANGVAAAAVALAAGATAEGCASALAGSPTLPHRVELIGEHGGVRFYDDSKATTPASVLAAVAGFGSVVLIAGGRNKGLDLGVLAGTAPPVRAVVAIGEAAAEIRSAFAGRVPVMVAADMRAAVGAAASQARSGDVVLLSPGCASFDWYGSYAERGDDFATEVRRLVGAEVGS